MLCSLAPIVSEVRDKAASLTWNCLPEMKEVVLPQQTQYESVHDQGSLGDSSKQLLLWELRTHNQNKNKSRDWQVLGSPVNWRMRWQTWWLTFKCYLVCIYHWDSGNYICWELKFDSRNSCGNSQPRPWTHFVDSPPLRPKQRHTAVWCQPNKKDVRTQRCWVPRFRRTPQNRMLTVRMFVARCEILDKSGHNSVWVNLESQQTSIPRSVSHHCAGTKRVIMAAKPPVRDHLWPSSR